MPSADHEIELVIEGTGAFGVCPYCRTAYDLWGVDAEDIVPPVGDGCDYCDPEHALI